MIGQASAVRDTDLESSINTMRFLNILLGAVAAGSAVAAPACDAVSAPKDKRASKFKYVGANQSGAEFGKNMLPGQLGKDYIWPAKSSIDVSSGWVVGGWGVRANVWCRLLWARG